MICKTQRNSFTIRTNASRSHKKYIHRKSDFIKYFYSVINQWYDFQLSLITRLVQLKIESRIYFCNIDGE